MPLNYLDFDYSEDADGIGTFDTMAAVLPAQLPALQAEVAQLLAWAHAQFPHALGPAEEGGEWQYDLQGVHETCTPLALFFDPATGALHATPGQPALPRTTVTLSVSGSPSFCVAMRETFGID